MPRGILNLRVGGSLFTVPPRTVRMDGTGLNLLRRLTNSAENYPTVATGQDTVSSPGTAEPLNGGTALALPAGASISITALPDNTGNVYVGNDGVDSTNGDVLTADTSVALRVTDASNVYIDADNAGEGVSWITEADG